MDQFNELLALLEKRELMLFHWLEDPEVRHNLRGKYRPAVAYTSEITTHPAYRWLLSSPAFVTAQRLFARREPARWSPAAESIEELSFLHDIVSWTSFAILTEDRDWKPPIVSVSQRKRALKNAVALLASIKRGVQLTDVVKGMELESLLVQLCRELASKVKRDYSGPDARERALCVRLGKGLAAIPGLPNVLAVQIIQHFADLCRMTISHRSAQRYMTMARAQFRKEFGSSKSTQSAN